MQQEDDLRALAKIMEFGRAVSIFILVVHVYVYCYPSMSAWHLNLDVIDRILMNFDRTTGIFGCILWTKLMAVLLLAISCMDTILSVLSPLISRRYSFASGTTLSQWRSSEQPPRYRL